jgi:hypothetical protein
VGITTSFGAGGNDVYLVKTDANGNMLWNKTYGGTGTDQGDSVIQTSDGGYAITGYSNSFGTNYDVLLVKTDANGVMQWNKTYGGTGIDHAFSLVQTSDGGYAVAGITISFGSGGYDVYLVKTDASGTMQWNKTYGGTGHDYGYSLILTNDGEFAIGGYTNSFGVIGNDFYLVKASADGTMQWNKTYGGVFNDMARSLIRTSDGGYALAGYTNSFGLGGDDMMLLKMDASGNMQWNETFGGTGTDQGYAVVRAGDGGYVVAGHSDSFSTLFDMFLFKTDIQGDFGLARTDMTANTITLYRGTNDMYWNLIRVRIWKIK